MTWFFSFSADVFDRRETHFGVFFRPETPPPPRRDPYCSVRPFLFFGWLAGWLAGWLRISAALPRLCITRFLILSPINSLCPIDSTLETKLLLSSPHAFFPPNQSTNQPITRPPPSHPFSTLAPVSGSLAPHSRAFVPSLVRLIQITRPAHLPLASTLPFSPLLFSSLPWWFGWYCTATPNPTTHTS